jgi:ABC-type multidrug transport system fused ATPase/permease subunit
VLNLNVLRKLNWLLTPSQRKQVLLLFVAFLTMAFFDVVSIASVMPFIGMVSNPDIVHNNVTLYYIFQLLDFSDTNGFLIFCGSLVLVLVVVSNAARLFSLWFIAHFVQNCKAELSTRLLKSYLWQPYAFFLSRNSADLSKNVVEEVNRVVHNILHHLLEIAVRVIQAVFIFVLLAVMDLVLALLVMGVLGGSYILIFFFVKKKLSIIGQKRIIANEGRFKAVNEALGGVKDIQVLGRRRTFLDRFSRYAARLAKTESYYTIVSQAPKFALETIAFGGVLLIVLYFLMSSKESNQLMPTLALYAFAGYRLMPALQVIFVGVSTVKFNLPSLEVLYEELRTDYNVIDTANLPSDILPLNYSLELSNIVFSYDGEETSVINGLSLKVEANTTVGFVGTTGSGKTTLVDLLLGLLHPQEGGVMVDGKRVEEDMFSGWQRNIGYVPQSIYLADDTIAHNIAFGIPEGEINFAVVERAARAAHIHDFVTQDLPQGYSTIIGERGVRLSGGQRQRIGIARALYHDPQVLILDEATSALDNTTEEQVMREIQLLMKEKTIIMIAHRLATLRACDQIFFLECGRIVDSGTFEELVQGNDTFRGMARKNRKKCFS